MYRPRYVEQQGTLLETDMFYTGIHIISNACFINVNLGCGFLLEIQ
jgi:hypothetical protein